MAWPEWPWPPQILRQIYATERSAYLRQDRWELLMRRSGGTRYKGVVNIDCMGISADWWTYWPWHCCTGQVDTRALFLLNPSYYTSDKTAVPLHTALNMHKHINRQFYMQRSLIRSLHDTEFTCYTHRVVKFVAMLQLCVEFYVCSYCHIA